MGDGERERGGDRRVDRRAAGGDDVRADLRRDLVLRRDHPALRPDRHRARAGGDRQGEGDNGGKEQAVLHAADYTRFSFQVPRRNSHALTSDISENAIAIAQKTAVGP